MLRKQQALTIARLLSLLLLLFAGANAAAADDGSYGNAIAFTSYTLPPVEQDRVFEISGSDWTIYEDSSDPKVDHYITIGSDEGYDVLPLIDTPEKRLALAAIILQYSEWFDLKFARSCNITIIADDLEAISTEHSSKIVLEAHDTDPDLEQPSGNFDRLYFGDGFRLGYREGSGEVTLMMAGENNFLSSSDNRSRAADAANKIAEQNGYVPRPHLENMIWIEADRLKILSEDLAAEEREISMDKAAYVHELDIQFDPQSLA